MADLTQEENQLLEFLLYMTGRQERLERRPLVQKEQIAGIQAIWPILKSPETRGMGPRERCDLLNRLLLSLGIKTVSFEFFQTVFGDVNFSDLEQVRKKVEYFRMLCMLEYGSFRFGYKQFRQGTLIQEKWTHYFPPGDEVGKRARDLRTHPEPVGLVSIPGSQLFALPSVPILYETTWSLKLVSNLEGEGVLISWCTIA